MLGKCSSPSEIGCFTLLDIDVGGIPRDSEGLVRLGDPDLLDDVEWVDTKIDANVHSNVTESSPPEDITFHIEADWNANPDTALICIRYRGRRITTISPAAADSQFCRAYVEPVEGGQGRTSLPLAITGSVEDFLGIKRHAFLSTITTVPLLFQALDRPRLRYAAQTLYNGMSHVRVASNCVRTASEQAQLMFNDKSSQRLGNFGRYSYKAAVVIISGLAGATKMARTSMSISGSSVYEIKDDY
jgi:hypothetical protein